MRVSQCEDMTVEGMTVEGVTVRGCSMSPLVH